MLTCKLNEVKYDYKKMYFDALSKLNKQDKEINRLENLIEEYKYQILELQKGLRMKARVDEPIAFTDSGKEIDYGSY
jgi:hypothetical protein